MLMATGLWVYNGKSILAEENILLEDQGLVDIFRRTHVRELHERDEYVVSVWGRIKEGLQGNLKAVGLGGVGGVKEGDVKMLEDILEVEIPKLRRLASPVKFGDSGGEEGK